MREAVTSDRGVLSVLVKSKKSLKSAEIAKAMGITVFQITARLKGMEKRLLVAREKASGNWLATSAGKERLDDMESGRYQPPKVATPNFRRHMIAERDRAMEAVIAEEEKSGQVPVFYSMRGWKLRYEWHGSERVDIFTAPDGMEFVIAQPGDRADIIRKYKQGGLSPTRLRIRNEAQRSEWENWVSKLASTLKIRGSAPALEVEFVG